MNSRLLEQARKLKARDVLPIVTPIAVAAIAALIAVLAIGHVSILTSANNLVMDFEIARLTPAELPDPNIVIVAINEQTLQRFPYRAPLDRKFISDLLIKLASDQPRAIGLDYFFDQPTEINKDALLRNTIANLKVPLVVSYTNSGNVETNEQQAYLDKFVPQRLRGLANIAEDDFDVARWIYPGTKLNDGSYVMGFPRAIAAKLGVKTPDDMTPIAWRGQPDITKPASAFKEFPAHVVNLLPASWFKDKIVLIGSDMTLVDRHRTPFMTIYPSGEGVFPGIVIQAYALSQLLSGRQSPAVGFWVDVIIVLGFAALGAVLGFIGVSLWLRVGAAVLAILLLWAGGLALFHYGDVLIGLIAPTLSFSLAFWAMEALSGREARRQREFIQSTFSRYVAPQVVSRLIRDPEKLSLEGERRIMTFLFSDVADFTTMSESMESKQLAHVLNSYLDGMTGIVLKHGGMVDKFIGDAVFAIFNAPMDQPDHCERGVRCALDIDHFSETFRAQQKTDGVSFGRTRVGVHTGPAVIGNFGSHLRFDYTAQGDSVNTASRLEGINKHFGTRLCVSESTRTQCPNIYFRPVASIVLKGKTAAVDVWEPVRAGEEKTESFMRYCQAFEKLKEEAPEALALFTALHEKYPDDPLVALHFNRLHHGSHGVTMVMTEK